MRNRGSIIPKGEGKWLVRVGGGTGLDGKRITKSLMVAGTKTEAKRKLAELIASMDTGGSITVSAAVEKWLQSSKATASTLTRKKTALTRVLAVAPKLASMPAAKVKPSDIDALARLLHRRGRDLTKPHSRNKEPGLAPRTVNFMLIALGQVFTMLERDQIIDRNPLKLAQKVSEADAEHGRHFEQHELTAILGHFSRQWLYPILLVLLGTGARRSEVLALRWSDVDLEAGVVRFTKTLKMVEGGWVVGPPKTRAGRRPVKLPRFAVEALQTHKAAQSDMYAKAGAAQPIDGYVFPSFKDVSVPIRPDSVTHAFNEGLKSLGIKNATLHSLRHTAATALIGQVPLPALAARLGHSGPRVTLQVYAHAMRESDDAAAAKMDDFHNSHTIRTPADVKPLSNARG